MQKGAQAMQHTCVHAHYLASENGVNTTHTQHMDVYQMKNEHMLEISVTAEADIRISAWEDMLHWVLAINYFH